MSAELRAVVVKDLIELQNLYVKKNFTEQQYHELVQKELAEVDETFALLKTIEKSFSAIKVTVEVKKIAEHIYGNYAGFLAVMNHEYKSQREKCEHSFKKFVVARVDEKINNNSNFSTRVFGYAYLCDRVEEVLSKYADEDPEEILEKVLFIDLR